MNRPASRFLGKSGKTRHRTHSPYRLRRPRPRKRERSRDPTTILFGLGHSVFRHWWSRDAFDRLLPSNHLLQYLHPCSRFSIGLFHRRSFRRWAAGRSKGGAVSRCPFPSWRVLQRRGRVLTADRPFTTSPRTSRHPRRLLRRRGSRSLPANPRERDAPCHDPRCLPSGDVGAPHLQTEGALSMRERAVSQRTSIPWALPPWSDETPPFARRTDPPAPLRRRMGCFIELVPARVSSATCLADAGGDATSLDHDVPTEFCNTIRRTGTT